MNNKIQAIILCGLDGSGKSTQAKKLVEYFQSRNIKCKYVWLRYPNRLSIPFAILLRILGISAFPIPESRRRSGINDLHAHSLLKNMWKNILFLDFKFVSYYKVFLPIKNKMIVVLDRFVIDAIVELAISTGEESIIEHTATKFVNLIPKNSKIIFLDIDPTISYKRNYEEDIITLERKRELYLQISKLYNILIIDANKSIETIHSVILKGCKLS